MKMKLTVLCVLVVVLVGCMLDSAQAQYGGHGEGGGSFRGRDGLSPVRGRSGARNRVNQGAARFDRK